jgi:hypothetical protein
MSCKGLLASSGGVTHWVLAPDEDDAVPSSPLLSRANFSHEKPGFKVMTVSWGQNAHNSELGHGEGEPKSATKPVRVKPLDGVAVFE